VESPYGTAVEDCDVPPARLSGFLKAEFTPDAKEESLSGFFLSMSLLSRLY
jgi:hypothetical protein